MTDAEVRLRNVARLLGAHATRCRINGVTLPADLALALAVAIGGQERTEVASGGVAADARCMTFVETAGVLAVSERTVRRLARSGQLLTVDIGSSPRVRVTDLVAYVADLPAREVA